MLNSDDRKKGINERKRQEKNSAVQYSVHHPVQQSHSFLPTSIRAAKISLTKIRSQTRRQACPNKGKPILFAPPWNYRSAVSCGRLISLCVGCCGGIPYKSHGVQLCHQNHQEETMMELRGLLAVTASHGIFFASAMKTIWC